MAAGRNSSKQGGPNMDVRPWRPGAAAARLHPMGRRTRVEEPVHSRLASARRARGLSRRALADSVGVHYQTMGYLERDEYRPSLALALRLARALHLPVEAVFSLEPFDDELPPPA
jgi:putative transcriptional regulator